VSCGGTRPDNNVSAGKAASSSRVSPPEIPTDDIALATMVDLIPTPASICRNSDRWVLHHNALVGPALGFKGGAFAGDVAKEVQNDSVS